MSKNEAGDNTYSEAVSKGHYDLYTGGLEGKHDNVRSYWEERIRMMRLRPHLQTKRNRLHKEGRGLRINDLGAGSGEALRLLTRLNRDDTDLHLNQRKVLPMDAIDAYLGSDLCEAMVEQGNLNFQEHDQVRFIPGDFSAGYPHADEPPFDLYFCSFCSFSHIPATAMETLFTEIAQHVKGRAILHAEWLGRHSLEWPCYWSRDNSEMLDYSMSYMPGSVGGEDEEPEVFPMTYWTGDEIRRLANQVARAAGCRIRVLDLYDSSIFVGRHVDTQEYNEWVRPLRRAVNRLHEPNVRTDLDHLLAEVVPVPGFDEVNGFLAGLQYQWNNLIEYTRRRLEKRLHPIHLKNWSSFPAGLQMALTTMDRVIDTAYWMQMGDPRANIIEPQLGYALHQLEMACQDGRGGGHSLIGIFEIREA